MKVIYDSISDDYVYPLTKSDVNRIKFCSSPSILM